MNIKKNQEEIFAKYDDAITKNTKQSMIFILITTAVLFCLAFIPIFGYGDDVSTKHSMWNYIFIKDGDLQLIKKILIGAGLTVAGITAILCIITVTCGEDCFKIIVRNIYNGNTKQKDENNFKMLKATSTFLFILAASMSIINAVYLEKLDISTLLPVIVVIVLETIFGYVSNKLSRNYTNILNLIADDCNKTYGLLYRDLPNEETLKDENKYLVNVLNVTPQIKSSILKVLAEIWNLDESILDKMYNSNALKKENLTKLEADKAIEEVSFFGATATIEKLK